MLFINWTNALKIYCCPTLYCVRIDGQTRLSSPWPPRADGLVKKSRRKWGGSSLSPCGWQPASLGRGSIHLCKQVTRKSHSGVQFREMNPSRGTLRAHCCFLGTCTLFHTFVTVRCLITPWEKGGGEYKDHKMAFNFCHFSKWWMPMRCS